MDAADDRGGKASDSQHEVHDTRRTRRFRPTIQVQDGAGGGHRGDATEGIMRTRQGRPPQRWHQISVDDCVEESRARGLVQGCFHRCAWPAACEEGLARERLRGGFSLE